MLTCPAKSQASVIPPCRINVMCYSCADDDSDKYPSILNLTFNLTPDRRSKFPQFNDYISKIAAMKKIQSIINAMEASHLRLRWGVMPPRTYVNIGSHSTYIIDGLHSQVFILFSYFVYIMIIAIFSRKFLRDCKSKW
jgi:hypothetical protein